MFRSSGLSGSRHARKGKRPLALLRAKTTPPSHPDELQRLPLHRGRTKPREEGGEAVHGIIAVQVATAQRAGRGRDGLVLVDTGPE